MVDTIGAGDAFCAGLIVALIEGRDLLRSVRFANAVAVTKAMQQGAHSHLDRAEIELKYKV